MISHKEFLRLRLAFFLEDDEIRYLRNWRYLGEEWIGEASGFTEWVRPASKPNDLRSASLDLEVLEPNVLSQILEVMRLPVRRAMSLDDLKALFGSPVETQKFAADRVTHTFAVGAEDKYLLECTFRERCGLTFLAVSVV